MKLVLLIASVLLLQTAQAGTWANFWSTPDQQAAKALEKGDAKTAAEKFHDPQWRASAQYYAKDYQKALRGFRENHSSTGFYNQGNALAFLKKYADAINAYDQALAKDPHNADAKHNREIVKKLLQQQKQQDKQQQKNKQQQQKNKQQQQNKQQQGNQSDKQQPSKNQAPKSDKQDKSKKDNNQSSPKSDQDKPSKQDQQSQFKQDQQNKSKQEQQQPQSANAKQADQQPTTEQQQSTSQHQRDRETEQWLAQIPDDPGGLLKQKFLRDHQRLQKQQGK